MRRKITAPHLDRWGILQQGKDIFENAVYGALPEDITAETIQNALDKAFVCFIMESIKRPDNGVNVDIAYVKTLYNNAFDKMSERLLKELQDYFPKDRISALDTLPTAEYPDFYIEEPEDLEAQEGRSIQGALKTYKASMFRSIDTIKEELPPFYKAMQEHLYPNNMLLGCINTMLPDVEDCLHACADEKVGDIGNMRGFLREASVKTKQIEECQKAMDKSEKEFCVVM